MAEKIIVRISPDGLRATLDFIGPGTTAEAITTALREHGVVHGIQSRVILEAIDNARKSGRSVKDLAVAEGTSPKFLAPPRVEHLPGGKPGTLPQLRSVNTLLELQRAEEFRKVPADLTVLAVKKNDLLGTKVAGRLEPGKTVTGKLIDQLPENEETTPYLLPGPGVVLRSENGEYRADTFGYAGILDEKVTVLPPIWISGDGVHAAYLNLPLQPESVRPKTADIQDALASAGVTTGIDRNRLNALERMLSGPTPQKTLLPIASGTPPQEPVDAVPEFTFALGTRAGVVRQDGSIDLKERQTFPSVVQDGLLATCAPPVPGAPGLTVRGEEAPVREPTTVELVAGENVRASREGDVQQLFSKIDGGASVSTAEASGTLVRYIVSVRPLVQISGNVDYETGNIDFKGNVEIKGNVVGGFKVKATGDIIVQGSVEDAAEIQGDGDLTVKQGIVGKKTKIQVKGGVRAKFIQDATIQAEGDVVAASYIRTATVQSKNTVTVEGKGSGGGIFGGETWALNAITARNVGSEHSTTTVLSLGVLPDRFDKFAEIRGEIEKVRDAREALLQAIGVDALRPDLIKLAIIRAPRKKNEILRYVNLANEAAKKEHLYMEEMDDLRASMKESARNACVNVLGTAHARVKIRIGNVENVLEKDQKAVRFHLDPTGRVGGIVSTNLSEISKK